LPLALLDVRVTLPPAQNVVGLSGVIVGVAGIGFTVTVVALEAALMQPVAVSVTV
jgi:xanthosine utilization system XapX-like protein